MCRIFEKNGYRFIPTYVTIGCFIFFATFFSHSLQAQKWANWGLEINNYTGKIIKHTNMEYENSNLSIGWDLNFRYQTYGKQDWNEAKHFPELGIGLKYFDYGNPEELGQSFALFPNLTIPILRKEKTFFNFMLGVGIAHINRHYDRDHNPRNTAIGSTWNNSVVFRWETGYIFNPHWKLNAGLGLVHYSNGGTIHPNYGINIVAGFVGLKYTPFPKDFIKKTSPYQEEKFKKWGFQMHYDMAFREYNRDKKLRPIQILSLAATYHLSKYNRGLAGIEIEKNKGIEETLQSWGWETNEARKESIRYMFFLADEIIYGDVSVLLQTGVYFRKKEMTLEQVYFKLSARYYLPPIGTSKTQFFFGMYLKSHFSVAEYIALGFGANL